MPAPRLQRFAPLILPLIVLLAAALVRFYQLDAQSLWNDEGNSLRLAERGLGNLLEAVSHDIHPPGYYLALKAWIALAGTSEFSLRALSALEGLLAVAVTIALGSALFARRVGTLAGLLVALSPFAVYYSQEARMYALLSAASTWLFVRWLRARTQGRPAHVLALGLALVTAAGLYTQYSYSFTLLAQGVLFAAWMAWRRVDALARRSAVLYAALNGLALALFLPWLPTASDQITQWPRTGVDLALGEQARTVLTWITVGNTAGPVAWIILAVPLLLALVALRPDRRPHRLPYGWRAALPLAWVVIVAGALFVSGAYREANLKFLLPAQIALALLIARGAAALWQGREMWLAARLGAAAGLVALVGSQIAALDRLYHDPAYARDDYRAIAAQIMRAARPGDAIILDAPNQAEVFSYYYAGGAPVYGLPRGLGGDDEQTRAEVRDVIERHPRIFVVFWGETERDPNRVVQATLDAHAYPVRTAWYGDVRLAQYAVLGDAPDQPTVTLDAPFGDAITLTGCALSHEQVRPGDVLGVTIFWQTAAPLDTRYQVTVQLLAPNGTLIAQHDSEPVGNRAPTDTWTPGDTVIDLHGIVIPPDLSPGVYTLAAGLYTLDPPHARLPVTHAGAPSGDLLALAAIEVLEP